MTVKTRRVLVGPELARRYLAQNPDENRNTSEKVVQQYARILREGKWLFTHQGLAIDERGWLIDGQHRLKAVVASGVPMDLLITTGLPHETFDVIDNGYRRLAQQLFPQYIRNKVSVASACRYIMAADGTVRPEAADVRKGVYWKSAPTSEVLACLDRWQELNEATSLACSVYALIPIPVAAHAAVITQALRVSPEKVPEWIGTLQTGFMGKPGDPRIALRNRFIRHSKDTALPQREDAYLHILKAWNAYVNDEACTKLEVKDGETIPNLFVS